MFTSTSYAETKDLFLWPVIMCVCVCCGSCDDTNIITPESVFRQKLITNKAIQPCPHSQAFGLRFGLHLGLAQSMEVNAQAQ